MGPVRAADKQEGRRRLMSEMSLEEWNRGVPCEEDGLSHCGRCKPKDLPVTVYRSSGSLSFHKSPDCRGLAAGQQKVTERGDRPSPVVDIHRELAISQGLLPCKECFPGHNRRV